MTAAHPGATLTLGEPAGRWVLAATVLGTGMVMLDTSVVNVALDRIALDLGAGLAGLQWVLNGYTLALAALILLGGSLADRLGRRRVFVAGVAWFALASALCALAPTTEVLIAARVLQGVGGALLAPTSLAVLSSSFAGADRSRAIGAWSGLAGLAAAAGPFLGGGLLAVGSWRLVFLINLPLAAVVAVLSVRHVPESSNPDAARHLDLLGSALGALGLATITYAAIDAGHSGWQPVDVVRIGCGIAVLALFVLHLRRAAEPLVPPALFAVREFSVANLYTLAVYAVNGTLFFLLVLELQVVAGFGPLLAGMALLPLTVTMLLLAARSGALAERIGPRPQLTLGPLVCAAGLLLTLRIGTGADYLRDVIPAMTVYGLGLAALVAPLTSVALAAAPTVHAGIASGVNNAVARTGGLLAVALVPLAAGLAGEDYRDPAHFAAGYRTATWISVVLMLVASLLAWVGLSGRRRHGPRMVHSAGCPVDCPHLESLRPADTGPEPPDGAAPH